MHIAAQGDQPYALTYFKSLGLSIDDRDYENSTPLHWAFVGGATIAIYYLLSWKPDVNAQDNEGLTPLHIAIKYSAKFKNNRSLRDLLTKGAERRIVSNDGKKAIDLLESPEV